MSAAIIAAVGVIIAAVLSYFGGRFAVRQARRANTEDRDAVWNAGYRAAAEPHLYWDIAMVSVVREAQNEINTLRVANGMEPKVFEEIPAPPPLFPKLDTVGK